MKFTEPYKYQRHFQLYMIKYLPLLLILLVSCTLPVVDWDTISVPTSLRWNLPAPTENVTRSYHPVEGRILSDLVPEEKDIIQRMNARLECLDGSRAQRIDVVNDLGCVDCYEEWVMYCPTDNQFLVVVSEQSSRGGFFLFEGRSFG